MKGIDFQGSHLASDSKGSYQN